MAEGLWTKSCENLVFFPNYHDIFGEIVTVYLTKWNPVFLLLKKKKLIAQFPSCYNLF
jgi:hypothetical protein